MLRRTLLLAIGSSLLSCKSQPAATPPSTAAATPASTMEMSTAAVAASATPVNEGISPQDIAVIERNLGDLESVITSLMCWCTFKPSGEIDCAYGGEGGRDTGTWRVSLDGAEAKIVATGPRPFTWFADYADGNVVHLRKVETDYATHFSIYCDEDRTCEKWDGPLVGLRDVSGKSTAYGKVKAKLSKKQPVYYEGDESGFSGMLMREAAPREPTEGSRISVGNEKYREDAERLAAYFERDLGQVEIVDEEVARYDILFAVGKSAWKPSRLRVAIKGSDCPPEQGDDCTGAWGERIRKLTTTDKFVGYYDGHAKEPRKYAEVWYMPGKEADAAEIRALLGDFTDQPPKKWEWGGDFDVLVVTGSHRL